MRVSLSFNLTIYLQILIHTNIFTHSLSDWLILWWYIAVFHPLTPWLTHSHSLRHANSPAFSTFMKSVKTIRVLLFCYIYHSNHHCQKYCNCDLRLYTELRFYFFIYSFEYFQNKTNTCFYPIIFRITNHRNTNMVYDGNGCISLTYFGEFPA